MIRPYKEMLRARKEILRAMPRSRNPLTRGATAAGRAQMDRAGVCCARAPGGRPDAVRVSLRPVGNAITAERVVAGLRERGLRVSAWDLSATAEADVAAAVEARVRCWSTPSTRTARGRWRCVWPAGSRFRWSSRLTGTDANHELLDPEHAPVVRRVLEGAAAVTAFDASIGEHVAAVLPDLRSRLVTGPAGGCTLPRQGAVRTSRRAGGCPPTACCSSCPRVSVR